MHQIAGKDVVNFAALLNCDFSWLALQKKQNKLEHIFEMYVM